MNARLKSVYRRRFQGGVEELRIGTIRLISDKREVSVGDRPINLIRKEFDLLQLLMVNPGHILSKECIAEHLWGSQIDQADSFNFVYYHVKNLRKKLDDEGGRIRTVYGIGYTLKSE